MKHDENIFHGSYRLCEKGSAIGLIKVGGQVLRELLNSNEDLEINCLVRSAEKAKKLPKDVKTVIGSNGDKSLMRNASSQADIVMHFSGSSDDEQGPPCIAEGLSQNGGWYIHTSGTDILTEKVKGDMSYGTIYDDQKDIDKLHNLPDSQPHRTVEKYVFGIEEKHQNVRTVIVCPPTIHGVSNGYDKSITDQIPRLIRGYRGTGKICVPGSGKDTRSYVHVADVARFYLLLVRSLIRHSTEVLHGYYGYYFLESGEFTTKEICTKLGKVLEQKGVVKNGSPIDFSRSDMDDLERESGGSYWLTASSRARATNARALGWTPKEGDVYSTLPEEIDAILKGA